MASAVVNVWPTPAALGVNGISIAWCTPLLDFTATQTVQLGNPIPGFVFIQGSARGVTISKAGSITTSFTFSIGNDGSNLNLCASQTPATTAFSTGAAPLGFPLTVITLPAVTADLATPMSAVITAGATGTGGFAWTGRLFVLGIAVPNS